MDHAAAAKRYRHQAEEFRAKSELLTDPTSSDQWAKLADAYEALAVNEDRQVQIVTGIDSTAIPVESSGGNRQGTADNERLPGAHREAPEGSRRVQADPRSGDRQDEA